MRQHLTRISLIVAALVVTVTLSGCKSKKEDVLEDGLPKPVTKTNPMKVYMHYMPWFQSKDVSGYWGSHWRMANKNPDIVDDQGKRQIASHYYPLIGPYDSKDENVLEYHLLLMKYAGVDGILVDWYGSHNNNDYASIRTATNAIVDKLPDVGVQFAVVYEEVTAETVANQSHRDPIVIAQEDMDYVEKNFFHEKTHIKIDGKPLLLTFGPRYFKQQAQWTQILGTLQTKPVFMPLWFNYYAGNNSDGQFAWVDFHSDLSDMTSFYATTGIGYKFASAFPRFHDFYVEGGWGQSYGLVDANGGETLKSTLAKGKASGLDHVQLVTWNDFGEGTVIEPTLEDGYASLEAIQQFTGVSYTKAELELVHDYYLKKVKYKDDTAAQATLVDVFHHLTSLNVTDARELLMTLN